MGKASRAVVTAILAVLLMGVMALPALAAPGSVGTLACWNNCGIGGTDTKNF